MNRMYLLLFGLVILLAGAAFWALNTILEFEKPAIAMKDDLSTIGAKKDAAITLTDQKSGIREVSVTISQEGRDQSVFSEHYPKGTHEQTVSLDIDSRRLKLKDGPATLTITVEDHSWLKNRSTLSVETTIDTVPPQIGMISSAHNINAGGTGVALYRVSEEVTRTGVKVGDRFSPGYPYSLQGKPCHIVYFAVPTSATKSGLQIQITAQDKAGNVSSVVLPHLVKEKKFRSDKINLSRPFLDQKMPEFRQHDPRVPATPLEAFLFVNETLRIENTRTIQTACSNTQPKQLWEGTFLRMKNSAPMASYAEDRTYIFEGMAVSKSTHQGVDLASTERAPIEAANNGIVVFAGYLGIYGNAVIVDHGFGLSSLYGHMSDISVKAGQTVTRGEMLGNSGSTGLAGGDHLHFSILVGGEFVNPTEWWDAHWIQDNVTGKLTESAPAPVPTQKAKPANVKAKAKGKKKKGPGTRG
jgi:murein DD-endopeptidase MepM/ murein hydrolase activator NlpD